MMLRYISVINTIYISYAAKYETIKKNKLQDAKQLKTLKT